jgi:hypothetical protein
VCVCVCGCVCVSEYCLACKHPSPGQWAVAKHSPENMLIIVHVPISLYCL